MKACQATALAAIVAAVAFDSALGMKKYLDQLPNGEIFEMELGHVTTDKLTDFGKAFSAAGSQWSTKFCQSTYPGATMTVGQAFGDPCCTWKVGEDAVKTVNAWAGSEKPTTPTTCDSASAAPATSPAPAAAPAATPAAAPSESPAAVPAPAPAPVPAAGKPNLRPVSKCGVKSDAGAIPTQREPKNLDDDESEETDN
jgi:hypothetical protein